MESNYTYIRSYLEKNGHKPFYPWRIAQRFGVSSGYVNVIVRKMKNEGWTVEDRRDGHRFIRTVTPPGEGE